LRTGAVENEDAVRRVLVGKKRKKEKPFARQARGVNPGGKKEKKKGQ